MNCTKAAMFVELPPKRKVNPRRDPFAGSLRHHMGLRAPNSEKWGIDVDGQRYRWKDGGPVIFDETFVREVRDNIKKTRLIVFFNVTRLQKNRHLQFIAECFSNKSMSYAVTPNILADKIGFINSLSTIYWAQYNNRKKLTEWKKNIYFITKGILLLVLAFYFIFYL